MVERLSSHARPWNCSNVPSDRGFSQREQLPLPNKPPYTAHLGNLSFDVTGRDIEDFFADCEVTNVRIVEDKFDHKPKGFGYVEFRSLEGLKKALAQSGAPFQGRNIRVSVAEPRKSLDLVPCEVKSLMLMGEKPKSGRRHASSTIGRAKDLSPTSPLNSHVEHLTAFLSALPIPPPILAASEGAAAVDPRHLKVTASSEISATGSARALLRQ